MTYAIIVAAKVVRSFAYGLLSVGFALYLASAGFSALAVGATLSVSLLAGAAYLAAASRFVSLLGGRTTLVVAAIVMSAAGALLASHGWPAAIVFACLLGTFSAGGQEVGPFAAVEQHVIAETSSGASAAHAFATYNLAGAFALALGALATGAIPTAFIPWAYAGCAIVLVAVYLLLPQLPASSAPTQDAAQRARFGTAERLAALFGVDALAGGFVVQSFIAYWLHIRFGADQQSLALVLFGANTLSALSYPVAAWLSTKIGLLRTMVFTHLPSNVLLCLVPFMPSYEAAIAVILARFALSQMDVPTRQAFAMDAVAPSERVHAAALTNAVRPAAAAIAPVFAGLAVQTAALGVPFFIAGGLKVAYDLAIYRAFRRLRRPHAEEAPSSGRSVGA